MGLFDTMPAAGTGLDAGYTYAASVNRAFVLNAGSGTKVKEWKSGLDFDLYGSYSWLTKGLRNARSGFLWRNFITLTAPYTVIAGLLPNTLSGISGVIGTTNYLGVNVATLSNSAYFTATKYVNAVAGTGPISTGVEYILAWDVTVGDVGSPYWLSEQNSYGFVADWAFLYVFKGHASTPDLLTAIQAAPYGPFGVGGAPAGPNFPALWLAP